MLNLLRKKDGNESESSVMSIKRRANSSNMDTDCDTEDDKT